MPLSYPPLDFDHLQDWGTRQLHNRKHWDETPEAGFLFHDPRSRNALGHRKFPITPMMWHRAGKPYRVLSNAAKFSSTLDAFKRDAPPTASIRGIYLRNEGYAPPKGTEEEYMRRVQAGGSVPPLSQNPDSQEVRMLSVIDCTSRMWTAEIRRGKEHEPPFIAHAEMKGFQGMEGNLVDAMKLIMGKFTSAA